MHESGDVCEESESALLTRYVYIYKLQDYTVTQTLIAHHLYIKDVGINVINI